MSVTRACKREREGEHSSTSALALTVAKHCVLMDAQNQPALNKSLQLIHTKDCCCFIHYDVLVCICSLCFLMWCLLTWVCVCVCAFLFRFSLSTQTRAAERTAPVTRLCWKQTNRVTAERETGFRSVRHWANKVSPHTHMCVCNILIVPNAHTQTHIYNNQKTYNFFTLMFQTDFLPPKKKKFWRTSNVIFKWLSQHLFAGIY